LSHGEEFSFFWKSDLNIKFWSGLVWFCHFFCFLTGRETTPPTPSCSTRIWLWRDRGILSSILSSHLSTYLSFYLSSHLSIYILVFHSIFQSIYQSLNLFTHLSIYINFESLSVCFYMFLSTYMFLLTTNSLSFFYSLAFPYVNLSFNLYVFPPIYLLVLISPFLYLCTIHLSF
jgi:hypothetical protein